MAINTKAKRMSMLSFASPLAWGHHFDVDGAIDADDRAHLLHLYGGSFDSGEGALRHLGHIGIEGGLGGRSGLTNLS